MAYPEGLAQMPGASVWAVMFFFMLFTVGLGSQVRDLIMATVYFDSESVKSGLENIPPMAKIFLSDN